MSKSKTVLITGASSGIGEATAKYFLQKGWNVAATMRSPIGAGDWTKTEKVICPRLDVTSSETMKLEVENHYSAFQAREVQSFC